MSTFYSLQNLPQGPVRSLLKEGRHNKTKQLIEGKKENVLGRLRRKKRRPLKAIFTY